MEGGWKTPPPQCYNETKKPSAYRVKGRERVGPNDTKCAVQNMEGSRFFPGPFRRGGGLSPHMGGQRIMGGPLRGDTDIMGDLTLIDYIIH